MMEYVFDKILSVMKCTYGQDLSIYNQDFLNKSLARRQFETGAGSDADYLHFLENSSDEADILIRSLNISFSQFFRDPVTFAILQQNIFPDIVSRKKDSSEIRVWSAGCANGQEAYSLAMLLAETTESCGKNLRYRIFATDISREAVTAAMTGIYNECSVQNVKKRYLDKYFIRQDKSYTVIPAIRQCISFSVYNLLDLSTTSIPEGIYGDFDVIMCSNVLIYYQDKMQRAIIGKLEKATAKGGYLVTGEAEMSLIENTSKLRIITAPAAVFQK